MMENDNTNFHGDVMARAPHLREERSNSSEESHHPQEMLTPRDTMNRNTTSTLSSSTIVEDNKSCYDDPVALSTAPEHADIGEAQHSAKSYPDACPDKPERHIPQHGCSTVPCSGRSGSAFPSYRFTCNATSCRGDGDPAVPGSQLQGNIQDSMSPRYHSIDDLAISGKSGHGTSSSSITNRLSHPTATDFDVNFPAKHLTPRPDRIAATGNGQSSFQPTPTPVAEESGKGSVNDFIPSVNVVIFGETGVGKSSVINLIAGENRAYTSNAALGCTFKYERHKIELDGVACDFWDTSGLDEGDEGTVPAEVAERNLRELMRELARTGGIHLLIYCIRGTRLTKALKYNYDLFYAAVCRKKVPVALVATCLEHQEGEMETWWHANERRLRQSGMQFDAHACVTTLDVHVKDETLQDRRSESQRCLRELVLGYSKRPPWRIEQSFLSWIFSRLPVVLGNTLPAGRTGKIKAMRKVVICDVATRPQTLIQVSPGITAHCSRLSVTIRGKDYEFVWVDKHALQTTLQYKEDAGVLVFYTSALVGNEISQEDVAALKTFYDNAGGYTCPVIVVLRGCNDQETALKAWGSVTFRHDISAEVNFLPSAEDTQSDKLNDIIEKCIEHDKISDIAELYKKPKHFFPGTRALAILSNFFSNLLRDDW